MKFQVIIGLLLLLAALLILLGMFIGNPILWSIIDIVVACICLGSGIWLLVTQKK